MLWRKLGASTSRGLPLAFFERSPILEFMISAVLQARPKRAARNQRRRQMTATLRRARRLISRLALRWNARRIVRGVEIAFDSRLRTSIARYSPRQRRIRLNRILLERSGVLPEAVGHELAHLVAFTRHGPGCRPHGLEWQQLMRAANLPARRTLRVPLAKPRSPNRPAQAPVTYVHRCPVCQASWIAKRRMASWRCASCMESGLPGTLIIERKG